MVVFLIERRALFNVHNAYQFSVCIKRVYIAILHEDQSSFHFHGT